MSAVISAKYKALRTGSDIATSRRINRLPKTREEYLAWQPRDGYKYEWVKGVVLKRPKMIKPEQYHIVKNLTRLFATTKAYQQGNELTPEVKSSTVDTHIRVPDIGYYSVEQQYLMQDGHIPTPAFAIEIISPTDSLIDVELNLEEYFKAGVQVLWHIIPETEKVYVYTSSEQVAICRGNTICNAESIIEGFKIAAKDIFKKPAPPQ